MFFLVLQHICIAFCSKKLCHVEIKMCNIQKFQPALSHFLLNIEENHSP